MPTPCSNLQPTLMRVCTDTHTYTYSENIPPFTLKVQWVSPVTTSQHLCQAVCQHTDSRMTVSPVDHFHNKITTRATETKPPTTGIPLAATAYYQVVKIVLTPSCNLHYSHDVVYNASAWMNVWLSERPNLWGKYHWCSSWASWGATTGLQGAQQHSLKVNLSGMKSDITAEEFSVVRSLGLYFVAHEWRVAKPKQTLIRHKVISDFLWRIKLQRLRLLKSNTNLSYSISLKMHMVY